MCQKLGRLARELRRRIKELVATGDAGYSTETVVVTAVLVIAALTVLAIIVAKLIAKANAIDFG